MPYDLQFMDTDPGPDGVRTLPVERSPEPSGTPSDGTAGRPLPRASAAVSTSPIPFRIRALLFGALAYLSLSLLIWSNVWSSHPTVTTTCGCGDGPLFTWFLAWSAHALAHGLNPFYTSNLFHPTGINLVANTGMLALGLILAPVTWVFGPVVSLNVALTLSPVLSALAMMFLLRRWVHWAPAAFVSGLFYGFSPFILNSLANAHLNMALVAVPPLIVGCLDELLVRQQRPPLAAGVTLGLLVTLQFFISTEVLLIMATMALIAIALVAVATAVRYREAFRQRVGYAVRGLAVAGFTATALLAYPVWFALDGPAHFSGQIWPGLGQEYGGTTLGHFLLPESQTAARTGLGLVAGLFDGPILSYQYLGLGAVAVVIGGLLIWRQDRRLWVFGAVGLIAILLSFGVKRGTPLPWQALAGLPLFENVFPARFVLVAYLAVAILIGLVVGHTHDAVASRAATRPDPVPHPPVEQTQKRRPRWAAAVAGLTVAAIAVVPPAVYLAQTVPVQVEPFVLPTWFRTVAPTINSHQVLLVFPAPYNREIAMTWQAIDGFGFSLVGGAGPGVVASRAGGAASGQAVVATVSFSFLGATYHPTDVLALRRALNIWGVTTIVIPDQPGLPEFEQIISVTYAAALVSAATATPPRSQAGAWVWTDVDHVPPAVVPTADRFNGCTAGQANHGKAAVDHATSCVLWAPGD